MNLTWYGLLSVKETLVFIIYNQIGDNKTILESIKKLNASNVFDEQMATYDRINADGNVLIHECTQ